MRCPNCDGVVKEGSRFCPNCGVNFILTTFAWLIRRGFAGAIGGSIGWVLALSISRILGNEVSDFIHLVIDGIICGLFIGLAGGIIEKSFRRSLFGIFGGLLGGICGGVVAALMLKYSISIQFDKETTIHTIMWMIMGCSIGFFNSLSKGFSLKALIFLIGGALGGAIGGSIGWQSFIFFQTILTPSNWFLSRTIEAFGGMIVGGFIWFCIGLAERFSPEFEESKEETFTLCKKCVSENLSTNRFCQFCGAHLVIGKKILPRRFGALRRIANGYRFLGRFVLIVGITGGIIGFVLFLPTNVLSALMFGFISVFISYLIFISLNAMSESISVFMDIEENTRKTRELLEAKKRS